MQLTGQPYQSSFRIVKNLEEEIRETVHSQMKGAMLLMAINLFNEEVAALCGTPYSRKNGVSCHRAGSDPGSILVNGQRVATKKPRVKKDGEEVQLKTYDALQSYDLLCNRIMDHMLNGVSARKYEPLLDDIAGGLGLKKSTVSKAFVEGSKQMLDDMNSRDLAAFEFCSIMVDGVEFGSRTVITALGITTEGKKLILGLREGDTENLEIVRDLLSNLVERGLSTDLKYLFVIDGGKAIKRAILKVFGDKAPIQRCVRHKERNILAYLDVQHHAEFRRRWKRLHGYTHYDAALAEHRMLEHWLSQINHEALNSLNEAELETLTVTKLEVPALLRKTLLSTNPIESAFSKAKTQTARVKNWKSSPDQISRWAASALTIVEKQFRLVRGFKEIPALIESLRKVSVENKVEVA